MIERVTGMFRTAAHAMKVVFRTSASERHGVMTQACGQANPGDAGTSHCCGQKMVGSPIKLSSLAPILSSPFTPTYIDQSSRLIDLHVSESVS